LTLDKPASALADEEELDEKKSQHIRSIYKAKPRSHQLTCWLPRLFIPGGQEGFGRQRQIHGVVEGDVEGEGGKIWREM
jgi:hypothetical protein